MDRNQIKLELKKWEKFFEKVNGRKPNRADVRAADDDIKSLYKRYFSQSTDRVWNPSLLKQAKVSKDKKKSQVCQPYLEKLSRNYSNMQFVKRTIMKRKKKKEEPEVIVDEQEETINPSGNILSQLKILTEPADEWFDDGPVSPIITDSTSDLISTSYPSFVPPEFIDSATNEANIPTLLYSPVNDPQDPALMPTVLSGEEILASDPVAIITLSFDMNNGSLDVQSDSGIVANGSVLSFNSNDTMMQSTSQSGISSAIDADLFAGDFDTDPLVLQVKECIDEKVDELEEEEKFEGCLLPLNYKRKRKTKVPTAKAIKKRNEENFVRIDMKKKSFASKGYKKLNVQNYKRKKYYNSIRSKNKCYTCGEQGHWSKDCPLNLPQDKNDVDETSTKSGPSHATESAVVDQGHEEAVATHNQAEAADPFAFTQDDETSIPLLTINYKH